VGKSNNQVYYYGGVRKKTAEEKLAGICDPMIDLSVPAEGPKTGGDIKGGNEGDYTQQQLPHLQPQCMQHQALEERDPLPQTGDGGAQHGAPKKRKRRRRRPRVSKEKEEEEEEPEEEETIDQVQMQQQHSDTLSQQGRGRGRARGRSRGRGNKMSTENRVWRVKEEKGHPPSSTTSTASSPSLSSWLPSSATTHTTSALANSLWPSAPSSGYPHYSDYIVPKNVDTEALYRTIMQRSPQQSAPPLILRIENESPVLTRRIKSPNSTISRFNFDEVEGTSLSPSYAPPLHFSWNSNV